MGMTVSNQSIHEPPGAALGHLRSSKSSYRLLQVEKIRANGVGDLIALPQLVVCGDQSAGRAQFWKVLLAFHSLDMMDYVRDFPRRSSCATRTKRMRLFESPLAYGRPPLASRTIVRICRPIERWSKIWPSYQLLSTKFRY